MNELVNVWGCLGGFCHLVPHEFVIICMLISQKFHVNLTKNTKSKKAHNRDTVCHENIIETHLHDIPMCNFLSDLA